MTGQVQAGTIVFHYWDPTEGLTEQEISFQSIDELFGRCLEIRQGETVNRVVLDGLDQKGVPRRLTLACAYYHWHVASKQCLRRCRRPLVDYEFQSCVPREPPYQPGPEPRVACRRLAQCVRGSSAALRRQRC